MSRFATSVCLSVLTIAVFCGGAPSLAQTSSTPLSGKYKRFLEEDARYLLTDQEEEIYGSLTTDQERENFIAAFWEVRDPTPGTTRNEFRDGYMERKKEANQLFRGSGREGWKTDRGRTYILLGEPKERRTFDHIGELWPIELWFYQVDDAALPPFFYLLFYRKSGAGRYRLWDMIGDGPEALIASSGGAPPGTGDRRRMERLFQGDADLYQAVTAPVPGEPQSSQAFAYQKILAVLEDYPNQSLNPEYQGRYRPGRGIVEVDYLFRQLNLAPLTALLPSENGTFLHYALEVPAEEVYYNQYETTYYTVFDLELRLETLEGQSVYQIRERREIEVREDAWEDARRRPVSLQGRLPIVPGEFVVRFLIRSRTGRVFDTHQTQIRVPETVDVSHLVAAGFFQPRTRLDTQLAFQFREALAVPHPKATYPPGSDLRAFLVLAPSESQMPLEMRAAIVSDDVVIHSLSKEFPGSTSAQPELMAIEIGLRSSLVPGDYRLELELTSGQKRTLAFKVDARPPLMPPLVNSPEEEPNGSGVWNVERAKQHIALGQNLAALDSLGEAVRRNPEMENTRLQLGVLALGLGQPERALEAVVPGLMRAPFHYDMLALAGYASELAGRLDDAVKYYERARQAAQPDDKLLRALASVYEKLGETEKAEAVRKQISG